ncbi:hypothetical protein [Solibacillus sp. FSL K6-1523]|uniref:hypothetical protein n=1 Tax=Solibacillus sp. FSL K6-1523 TaxID=2921471 RepID=UPI0030F598C8
MQLCGCQKIKQVRVEADISADSLWCDRCLSNLNVEDFTLTDELKNELQAWIYDYGKWIDWENDGIMSNGVLLEQQHNERGALLTAKVKLELDRQYQVVFSPSTFAMKYSK